MRARGPDAEEQRAEQPEQRRNEREKEELLQPRPTKGIFVAITFMNRMFASSGSDAI
jgi:hypothetical protein